MGKETKVEKLIQAMDYICEVAADGLITEFERIKIIAEYCEHLREVAKAYKDGTGTEYIQAQGGWRQHHPDLRPPTLDDNC